MDVMRVLQVALGAISFHEFAMKVLGLPEVNGRESGPELVKKLETLGVTYKGKPIERNVAYSILNIVGIADQGEGLEAVRFLERVDPNVLSDASKLLRTFQTVRKLTPPDEWQEGIAMVVESMAVAILAGDTPADAFSLDYLVPKARRSAGYIHGAITSMKFKKWFLDDLVTQASGGASTGLSLDGLLQIKSKCSSIRTFWTNFAHKEEIEDTPNCIKYTTEKFAAFKEKLTCVGDKLAADLIYKVMTNQFAIDFKEIAASGTKFADHFHGDADDDLQDSLHKSLQMFRASLITAPIPSTKQSVNFENAFTDTGDSEHVGTLYKQVTRMRKDMVSFLVINYSHADAWKPAGQATNLLQRSRFMKSRGVPGKENSLFLLNAELFPNRAMFQKADAYKQSVPLSDQLKEAAKWTTSSRLTNSICLFTDGRTPKIRKAFQDIAEETQTDEQKHFHGEIIYACPHKGDPRFAKTQTFAGLSNRESLVGILPVPKVRMHSKPRSHYSACGEKSTHAATYSNSNVRPWMRLPRLTLEDKEKIVGAQMPTYAEEVFQTLKVGHPLFMGEMKEVEIYLAIFEDLSVTHVFDLAAGSGAAAMAAAILRIHYEGLAMNAEHANWLNRIMDKAMFAIVVDSTDEESLKIKADVSQYFNANIEEARALLAGAPGARG